MRRCHFLFILLLLLCGCNHIESSSSLSSSDLRRLRDIHLLDSNEKVYKFYSEATKDVAGNFYTDRRMASYWIDRREKSRNEVNYAFYPDIVSLDTVYYAGASYSPYMLVTKKDGEQFKVCADGSHEEIKAFFEGALKMWKEKRDLR